MEAKGGSTFWIRSGVCVHIVYVCVSMFVGRHTVASSKRIRQLSRVEDHKHIRILHSGRTPKPKEIPATMGFGRSPT